MNSTDTAAILRSDDGTEIPFEWAYPGADAFEWQRDREHWPAPMPPMELWLHKHWPDGSDRAWAELAMEAPPMFHRFQYAGPFLYARETMPEPAQLIRLALRYREVSQEHGGPVALWENYCRPRIEAACSELAAMDGTASPRQIAGVWGYGFHQTFTSLVPMFETGMRLTAMLAEGGPDDGSLASQEVVQGGENATQAIDREIWELAELARKTPAVTKILAAGSGEDALASLRRHPEASKFVVAFDGLIERHGSRSQGWELTLPTWRERPEAALALVRAQMMNDGAPPDEVARASERRRREARERALSRLPADKHAEFQELVGQGEGYVSIREGRAYWQMVLCGEVRTALLRIGQQLVDGGRLERADDVFFVEPADIEDADRADLRPLVAERKRQWQGWRTVVAPEKIGAISATPSTVEPPASELRGSPASRGTATGPARIVRKPEDSSQLRHGEILVCVMTTPAWTPMFGVAAAIVTETGGPLSHPAITAREYGIPAVVAVKGATARIREGQTITVDGAAGLVTLDD